MAKGNEIIVSAHPQGKFNEGIISGTLKPGTQVQIQAGTAPVEGRFTYEAYNPSADNDPREVIVLLPDPFQGFLPTSAFVSGQRVQVYTPLPGEDINMLVKGQAGTGSANAFTIGERLSPEHGSGKLIQQSTSGNNATFQSMEHIDEVPNTDTLVWCRRASNG